MIAPDVVPIDTAHQPDHVVAQSLIEIATRGIWLTPLKGIPHVNSTPALDIVYLDGRFRVLRCLENPQHGLLNLPEISADSALLLPTGHVSQAQIQIGDHLELRDAATGDRLASRVSTPEEQPSQQAVESAPPEPQPRPETPPKGLKRVFDWLFPSKKGEPERDPSDRRKGKRQAIPGLVAYFSVGATRKPYHVSNISTEGYYVLTEERWTPGTSLLVALHIVNPASRKVEAMVSIQSKVVWVGPDGVGFAYDDEPSHRSPNQLATNREELIQLQKFLQMIKR